MALSSLLLPKKASLDTELDDLFKAPAARASTPVAGPSKTVTTNNKKRKLNTEERENNITLPKRTKTSPAQQPSKITTGSKKAKQASAVRPEGNKAISKGKGKGVESDEDDEDDVRLENAYLDGKRAAAPGESSRIEDEDSDEGDVEKLVHESVTKKNKKVRALKTKHVPVEETPELRDQRTIFVGNLPIEVASKKPLQKQLKHHFLASLPMAKIESIRFRSIPFQAPTTKLEDENEKPKTKAKEASKKAPRAHEKERASVWRSKQDKEDEEIVTKDDKRYLNPAQKKKIAFINQEFHSSANTINAYIVFAHPRNTEDRPANLPPLPPTMNPYQAAVAAAEKCDGTMFMERMLRVDLVTKNKPTAPTNESDENVPKPAILETDPRLSVFVGNLDFASKEEDLRLFFETLMTTEKGLPLSKDPENGVNKPFTWVTRVRIVRDKDTQLGKGFGYVQFTDHECVDELVALEQEKLKFAKRKLRVQRCKTAPGSKEIVTKRKERAPAVVVPRGDPRLGEKLHGLPKEERKQIKSTDVDRVARRLAKKKARMAMTPGVGRTNMPKGKDRKRAR